MLDHTEWYERTYPELSGFGSWLKGGELNTLSPEEYSSRPFRVLFARLSSYVDVGYSFTHSLLYETAAKIPGVFPDLSFLPPENDAKIFERDSIPWLLGTNTKKGPGGFDMIGLSNSIVQELVNVPHFLAQSGIPLKKSGRMKDPKAPIILLGGANALYSSALWGEDPVVDGVFVGESPRHIGELLRKASEGKLAGLTKTEILLSLSAVPGFFLPEAPSSVKTSCAPRDVLAAQEKGIVPYNYDQIGEASLQLSEGCRSLCGFCAENWSRKPYRELEAETLAKKAFRMKAAMGLDKVNFFSFNFNMYSDFLKLLSMLMPSFWEIGLKSQRFDTLAKDPSIMDWLYAAGKHSFSCGLEGISPRIRKYLNKNLAEGSLTASISLVLDRNVRELKIFLLVTGIEEEDDFSAFDKFLSFVSKQKKRSGAGTRLILSVTPLVRFPWTPLEFAPAPDAKQVGSVFKRIRSLAELYDIESREAMSSKEYEVSQALVRISLGPEREAFMGTVLKSGFVYYRYVPSSFFSLLRDNFAGRGLDISSLFCGFSLEESASKSWARVSTGVSRGFLWNTYIKNLAGEEIGSPFVPPKTVLVKEKTVSFFSAVRTLKRTAVQVPFSVAVSAKGRGIPRKYLGAVLASSLMRSDKLLIPLYMKYVSSFWADTSDRPVWIEGNDILTLSWNAKAADVLRKNMGSEDFLRSVNSQMDGWGSLSGISRGAPERYETRFLSPELFSGEGYFEQKGLKYTSIRKGLSYTYELSGPSAKKGFLTSLSFSPGKEGLGSLSEVIVASGAKFDPEEFARLSFPGAGKNSWVKTRIFCSFLPE
jgi:radical SAM superfamily enzyme YgiQ (UPF0313 family)